MQKVPQTEVFQIYAIKVALLAEIAVGKDPFAGFLIDLSSPWVKALGIEIFTCRGEAEVAIFTAEQRNAKFFFPENGPAEEAAG